MYLILASAVRSWLHPMTILLSLPLTLPFALLSLIIFQRSLNIFSGLGLLVYSASSKNSILRIDPRQTGFSDRGMNTHDAVIQASHAIDSARFPSDDAGVRSRHGAAGRIGRSVHAATNLRLAGW
jgi:multidrug efflux pump subunit AcrB